MSSSRKERFKVCGMRVGKGEIAFTVGRGGEGGERDGQPGEDTVISFRTPEGKVLKSIRARGGRGGKAGSSRT